MTNPHPDTDRLRYEIEKPTNAKVYRGVAFILNFKGNLIAKLTVKAWK